MGNTFPTNATIFHWRESEVDAISVVFYTRLGFYGASGKWVVDTDGCEEVMIMKLERVIRLVLLVVKRNKILCTVDSSVAHKGKGPFFSTLVLRSSMLKITLHVFIRF